MGELFTMKFAGLNVDEWKIAKEHPVILECLKDNSVIEIVDTENKIRKMTFRQGGKIFIDKIEDEYRFYWNDDDLI